MTPGEFIKHIRLKEAANLLLTTSLHVTEIFYRTGFNNQSYFFREFRKRYECAPNEYRERKTTVSREEHWATFLAIKLCSITWWILQVAAQLLTEILSSWSSRDKLSFTYIVLDETIKNYQCRLTWCIVLCMLYFKPYILSFQSCWIQLHSYFYVNSL